MVQQDSVYYHDGYFVVMVIVKVKSGFSELTLNVSVGTSLHDSTLINEHMSLITIFHENKMSKSTYIAPPMDRERGQAVGDTWPSREHRFIRVMLDLDLNRSF